MKRVLPAVLLAAALLGAAPPAEAQYGSGWTLYKRPGQVPRATDVPRANDIYVRRAPVRVYPKVRPTPKADIEPLPRYGRPKPAIERIPPT